MRLNVHREDTSAYVRKGFFTDKGAASLEGVTAYPAFFPPRKEPTMVPIYVSAALMMLLNLSNTSSRPAIT